MLLSKLHLRQRTEEAEGPGSESLRKGLVSTGQLAALQMLLQCVVH